MNILATMAQEIASQYGFPSIKSYAPRGLGNQVKGDLGQARAAELRKVFKGPVKSMGPDVKCSTRLPYRMPEIEGGQGPRAA